MFSSAVRRFASVARQNVARVSTRGFATASRMTFNSSKNMSCVAGGVAAFSGFAALHMTQSSVQCAKTLPPEGIPGTKHERTFIALKPDAVQRGLTAKIIQRFLDKGFVLVAMKMVKPTPEQAAGHYADLAGKGFFPGLVKFFSSGPIVAMVWEGKNAIKTGRVMLGETNPAASKPGTIRGDYCIEVGRNITHGSDGPDSAKAEINFWFTPEEIVDWEPVSQKWVYEK